MAEDLARMRWRCRRGMRELDTVLIGFLENGFAQLSDADKRRFDALLELPDPVLYAYLLRRDEPQDTELAELIERIHAAAPPRA